MARPLRAHPGQPSGVKLRFMRSPGLLRLVLAAGAFVIGIDAVIVSGPLPGITSSPGDLQR
jgi:hypothetical protein